MELCSRLHHTESTKECQVIGRSLTPFSKARLCWGGGGGAVKSSLRVSSLGADSNQNYRNFTRV